VGIALALVAAAVCVRLGFWQLARLRQRLARNAVARAAWALPPINLVGAIPLDSARNRRVRVRGVYDFSHQQLWRPHVLDEAPGVDLVTPVRLADGRGVLVDRGWVPSADAYHVDERAYQEPDSADVVGLALAAPRTRGDVDPPRLKDAVPYPLLPFVVQQLPDSVAAFRPNVPQRLPAPELTNGPHLSYAIQWFSFATIILVGSAILFWKAGREG
jgi:surfeit locus 1 family protein